MTETWPDMFVRILIVSGFGILLITGILMAVNSVLTDKFKKSASYFETAAKITFALWFLNNTALGIFGILTEWFALAKWEIWTTYGVSLLLGAVIWLLAHKTAPKEDRNLLVLFLLFVSLMIVSGIFVVSMITGRWTPSSL